jgi:hypothetical protein
MMATAAAAPATTAHLVTVSSMMTARPVSEQAT